MFAIFTIVPHASIKAQVTNSAKDDLHPVLAKTRMWYVPWVISLNRRPRTTKPIKVQTPP